LSAGLAAFGSGGALRPRTALLCAAIPSLLLAAFLTAGMWARFGGNPTALFYFGDDFSKGALLPADPVVRVGSGYDGQFYYRIALAPFLPIEQALGGPPSETAPGIDAPAYRYRRILPPLSARLLALGRVEALPWTFPLLNVLALGLGVLCTIRLFEAFGWSGALGLAYALIPGLVFAASRNLCEGAATAVLAAALLAIVRRRRVLTVVLLTAAHLAHEATLAVSIGHCAAWCLRRQWRDAALAAVPIALALAWYALVAVGFGIPLESLFAGSGGGASFAFPGSGLWHRLVWLWDPKHPSRVYATLPAHRQFVRREMLLVLPVLLALFVLLRAAWTRRSEAWGAALVAAMLIASFGDAVWADAPSFARVSSVGLLVAIRVVAEDPHPIGYAFFASLPISTLAAFAWCWDNWKFWPLAGG
jgi:hypothetical protein